MGLLPENCKSAPAAPHERLKRSQNRRRNSRSEYALAEHVKHPLNVYVQERDVLPALDDWLATLCDLMIAAHLLLGGPLVLIWDNLNTHRAEGMREFVETHDWLTVYQLPS